MLAAISSGVPAAYPIFSTASAIIALPSCEEEIPSFTRPAILDVIFAPSMARVLKVPVLSQTSLAFAVGGTERVHARVSMAVSLLKK